MHDPDDHFDEALAGAFRALQRLRDEGVVGAIGVGANHTEVLCRFAREADPDCFLVAGRYTVLDRSAADDLLPLCEEHGIAVIAGGVFNSGVLAGGNTFDYETCAARSPRACRTPSRNLRAPRRAIAGGRHAVPAPASGHRRRARRLPHAGRGHRGRAARQRRRAGRTLGAAGVIVDAHQHFWDPAHADYPWMTDEVAPLRQRFAPDDLEPLLREHGVSGTVVVQARHSLDETQALLAIATAAPFVLGVVGWVDLTADVERQLGELDGTLVGVRHQVQDEADPAWLLRDDVQRGLAAVGEAGLVYDLLVRTRELPAAVETVRRHPELRFVLDHAGKPPRSGRDAWAEGVSALAKLPNVTCKLSGLFTEADPEATVVQALQWFGPDRCMFGSDWPVCLLASEYGDAIAIVGEDEDVLAGTAIRTYGFNVASLGWLRN